MNARPFSGGFGLRCICRYAYAFVPGRPFDRYGLEQQAEIVRHAFLQGRGVRLAGMADPAILPFRSA